MARFILTTRPAEKQPPEVSSACFDILNIPVTRLEINSDFNMSSVVEFRPSIAIFTSSYGANAFLLAGDLPADSSIRFIAIGDETAKVLGRRYGDIVVPVDKSSEGVISLLESIAGPHERVALFVSSRSNRAIEHYLQERGVEYLVEELYFAESLSGTVFREKVLHADCFGLILTSSYEARIVFSEILDEQEKSLLLLDKKVFAIGKTTAGTLSEMKIPVSEPLGESNLKKLVAAIDHLYCSGE